MHHATQDFIGAKMALFIGPDLAVLLRDEKPGLLWPGYWDMPGGGREGRETPLECVQREIHEELALAVPDAQVRWGRPYTSSVGKAAWFFVGHLSARHADHVVFGNEGQRWALMSPQTFIDHPKAVPQFQTRLRHYLSGVQSEAYLERPPAE